ncbi:MAG: maleylpyruvate isomerase family mycothiol-dependent enzyme [Humibacillus sp.]|nr:maleylpyruvate isomerase family mycothiol-dependent enzyme [Humibacillus sp.]MDN5776339.1 maleylpyruvate isomerase family mycothiol-dependent enzyme [Humibacillus sp.]
MLVKPDDTYWDAVRAMRSSVADFLQTLTPQDWDQPSLCPGWRIRDVAGHLSLVPTITTWEMMAAAPRAGFDPNRVNTILARRYGSVEQSMIITRIRDHAGDRRTARVLDARNSLFDLIVHSQDMALPLGREFDVPVEYARSSLDRVWQMGWPFRAQRRLGHLALSATDITWTVGTGPQVSGTALTLLLLLTGRSAVAAPRLHGPGTSALPA